MVLLLLCTVLYGSVFVPVQSMGRAPTWSWSQRLSCLFSPANSFRVLAGHMTAPDKNKLFQPFFFLTEHMTKFWTKGYHYCDVSTILSTSSSPSHHPRGKCCLAKGDECSTLGTVGQQDRGGGSLIQWGLQTGPRYLGAREILLRVSVCACSATQSCPTFVIPWTVGAAKILP